MCNEYNLYSGLNLKNLNLKKVKTVILIIPSEKKK